MRAFPKMELYPAIDLLGGRCVRLAQGDYDQPTEYSDDPVAVARGFAQAGASWIHVVDLDAARTGSPLNRQIVGAVARAVAPEGVRVQSGGGVRGTAEARELWNVGVARVVVGTAAVEDPGLVAGLSREHQDGVAVGLDLRHGDVAVRGWVAGSGRGAVDVLAQLAGAGVAAVIVTDIARDGMLAGPDVEGLAKLLEETDLDVIASGGVSSVDDLLTLARLRGGRDDARGLAGVVVGRALYEGRFSVAEGVAACAVSA